MKLKAKVLVTVSLTVIGLVTATSLSNASQQIWNPDVAHAARVTANLLKGKSLRPAFFQRSNPPSPRSQSPLPLLFTYTELTNLNQRFLRERPSASSGIAAPGLSHDRQPQQSPIVRGSTFHLTSY